MSQSGPRTSYAGTAVLVPLIAICWIVSLLLQVVIAVVTCPLLLLDGGRGRFHHIQSTIWRSCNALFVVGCNPLWSVRILRVGDNSGPPRGGSTGSIIFCNHRSNADPWFTAWVQLCAGFEGKYVYKDSLKKVPLGGCCLMLAGDFDVKFGDKQQILGMLDRARDSLKQGYNIVVFPEGTRSPSGLLQNFKASFFEICAELGCPAVPLVVLGAERAWPAKGFRVGCAGVAAVLGEPLRAGPGGAAQLSEQVAGAFRELAGRALREGLVEEDDPLLTDQPYPWWEVPEEASALSKDEQMALLRAGKMHERGKTLA